ncbi:hypothetical protein ACFJIW_01415 [Tahibacter sp. UC22_41]|uniref:hypothetical protein n=1 Tax=Tahibacter sp. UC22_41 TaxID=3350178 RepID=UPI0036DBEB63
MNTSPTVRKFWKLLTAAFTGLAFAVAAYLLWRTQLLSRPVNIGADIPRFGMGSAALATVSSMPMLATALRRNAIRCLLVSMPAGGIIAFLYLTQLACSMKKAGVCEPLF